MRRIRIRGLFQSRLSRQTFWILLIGVLFIGMAGMSVFSTYMLYGRYKVSEAKLSNDVTKAVMLAKALPVSDLPDIVPVLRAPGLLVTMTLLPPQGSQLLQLTDEKTLWSYVHEHYGDVRFSTQLANGQWLNIHARRVEHTWFVAGLIASSVVLVFALAYLCIWAVRRLAVPVNDFIRAANRFGVDVQAPPLAPVGPPEMRKAIKAFNEMQNRIRRLVHDRTQMLAAISHDLRTPITRLQLRAEYLKGTPQYEKAVADLDEMERMISSILSFARDHVSAETMERFDLNALLDSLCDEMIDVGHSVEYHGGERQPYFGRISALKRVFSNLIENAVKYGDQAEVTLRNTGDSLQVKIVDQGPGIPEDQFEKVFAPFYRVDQSRSLKKSGTGLGMAVARDIVRAHGGDIALFNRDPKGLIVLVTLPLQGGY